MVGGPEPGSVPAQGVMGPGADPESLARVPSGPAYSVFSPSVKTWIIFMVTFSSFISPMTANIVSCSLLSRHPRFQRRDQGSRWQKYLIHTSTFRH
jgi:hypothetical protein